MAEERFRNEVKILTYLKEKECFFVPQLLEVDEQQRSIITTNCGSRVDHVSSDRLKALFEELESFGVRHNDPFVRNVTYHPRLGRFCLIDFEFATILESGDGLELKDTKREPEDLSDIDNHE